MQLATLNLFYRCFGTYKITEKNGEERRRGNRQMTVILKFFTIDLWIGMNNGPAFVSFSAKEFGLCSSVNNSFPCGERIGVLFGGVG